MRNNFAPTACRGLLILNAAIAFWFVLPCQDSLAQGQPNEKDLQIERLNLEIDLLKKALRDRDAALVKLEAELQAFRARASSSEKVAGTMKDQNEILLDLLRDACAKLARFEGGGIPAISPNKVSGKIEKVDGDLVQVNLGAEHGLTKNQTLDVYRVQPGLKYLGMIRIVDTDPQRSVGRQVKVGDADLLKLKAGDLVMSKVKGKVD